MNRQNINPKSSTRNPEILAKIKSAISGFCGVKKPDVKKTYTIERPTVYGDVVNDEIRKKLCTYFHYSDERKVPCCYCEKAAYCVDLNAYIRSVKKIRASRRYNAMQKKTMENYVMSSFESVIKEQAFKDKPCDGKNICQSNMQWSKLNRCWRSTHENRLKNIGIE